MAREENGNCLECNAQLQDRYKGTKRLYCNAECRKKYIDKNGVPTKKKKFEGY